MPGPLFNRLTIVGCGLIGSSIARIVREKGVAAEIVVADLSDHVRERVTALGLADRVTGDIGDGGYGVSPSVYRDKTGRVLAVLINRPLDTFRSETWELLDGKPVKLDLPERVSIYGVQHGSLILSPDQDWSRLSRNYKAGSLLAICLQCVRSGELAISNQADTIFVPTDRQSVSGVRVMDDRVVVAFSDNVVGRLAVFQNRGEWGWPRTDIATPENVDVSLGDSSKSRGEVFVSTQGFLTPPDPEPRQRHGGRHDPSPTAHREAETAKAHRG